MKPTETAVYNTYVSRGCVARCMSMLVLSLPVPRRCQIVCQSIKGHCFTALFVGALSKLIDSERSEDTNFDTVPFICLPVFLICLIYPVSPVQ